MKKGNRSIKGIEDSKGFALKLALSLAESHGTDISVFEFYDADGRLLQTNENGKTFMLVQQAKAA